jgi:hypothetical protein
MKGAFAHKGAAGIIFDIGSEALAELFFLCSQGLSLSFCPYIGTHFSKMAKIIIFVIFVEYIFFEKNL